jgi:23S rRNA (cytidine1920-2'-O)/16S rRNA (cytidine1409-2'-O)-methyltransferase
MKIRLDQLMVQKKLVATRSQAESWIKLGQVQVAGHIITKPGIQLTPETEVVLLAKEQYVSRAGLKLASVAQALSLDFTNRVILDVGSSTGGFTDYALQHGAKKVIAVEIGTNQLHPTLQGHPNIELHEKTDIRAMQRLSSAVDMVVIDVSFISLRELLPHIFSLVGPATDVVAMVKPQFEAATISLTKHRGIIKNDAQRRQILQAFEQWVKDLARIVTKSDSQVTGAKGNRERFYLLRPLLTK